MLLFELVIALLLIGVLLTLGANRLEVPYPALLALAGAGLALIPGTPEVNLDPELALALFVSPVLLDAAYDASPRDLRDNLAAVSSLALVAVALTITAVAWVVRLVVPEMSWPAAVALGAIVAPPDASAATAVLRRLRPPHRVVVVLEGESLFNDASALLVYRVAVGAAITGSFSGWGVFGALLLTCGGGVVLGVLLGHAFMRLGLRIADIPIAVLTQFLSTFAVWLLAEQLGLSAIITLVAYAMTIARHAPGQMDARRRIASYAVWDVAVFVLNVLAFVLIGLSLRGIASRIHDGDRYTYGLAAAIVCVTVIAVRVVWWLLYDALSRWLQRRFGARASRAAVTTSAGSGLVIAWCGMRGIVTLAAALALPQGAQGQPFPYRDLIVLSAFCVVLSTLVLQGLTLRPLLKRLGLEDDGTVERELLVARAETARAALRALEGAEPAAELLRREYQARLRFVEACASERDRSERPAAARAGYGEGREDSGAGALELPALQRQAAAVQRGTLMELRARSVIGDDAFHVAEEEIDLIELSADARVHPEA